LASTPVNSQTNEKVIVNDRHMPIHGVGLRGSCLQVLQSSIRTSEDNVLMQTQKNEIVPCHTVMSAK